MTKAHLSLGEMHELSTQTQPCVTASGKLLAWRHRQPQVRYQRPQGFRCRFTYWIFCHKVQQNFHDRAERKSQGDEQKREMNAPQDSASRVCLTPVAQGGSHFCLSAEAVLFVCHIFGPLSFICVPHLSECISSAKTSLVIWRFE